MNTATPHPPLPPRRGRRRSIAVVLGACGFLLASPAVASVLDQGALASAPVAIERETAAVAALDDDASVRVAAAPLTTPSTVAPPTSAGTAPVEPPATSTTLAPTTTTTRPQPVRTSVDFGGGLFAEVIAPAGPGPHPTLVYVHGGGWVSGDHLELPAPFGLADLPDRGWAVVSVGYRLADADLGIDAADQVAEVVRVIEWLRSDGHRLDLGGRLVGFGHSAGGHLLGLAAATMPPASAPDLVIGVAGVYDFAEDVRSSFLIAQVLPDALGCEPERCPDGWIESLTPGTHADSGDPTTILVHGDADPVVPVRTAIDHAALLDAQGVAVELVIVDDGDHYEGLADAVRAVLADALA